MARRPYYKNLRSTRYLVAGKQVVTIFENYPGRWFDSSGCEYACKEDSSESMDEVDRCGLGWASLSTDNKYTDSCVAHDNSYLNATYRYFHTRLQADEYLESLVEQVPGACSKNIAGVFGFLARAIGWITMHKWRKNPSERVNNPD